MLIGFDTEELHDYRLEMKKLKAFLHLLNTGKSPNEQVGMGKKMKGIYRLTGSVRNIQLYQLRIQDIIAENGLKAPAQYLQMLDQEKRKAMKQLQIMATGFSFDRFEKKIEKGVDQKLDADKINEYLKQQRYALVSILIQPLYSDEALHEVRKRVKEIGYNRQYISNHLSLFFPASFFSKERTDLLSEKLGVHNDARMSLGFLEPHNIEKINSAQEQKVLQTVKSKIETMKLQEREDIEQQLSTVLRNPY